MYSIVTLIYYLYFYIKKDVFCGKEMINRPKIALAEEQKSSKWQAERLGKNRATVSKWGRVPDFITNKDKPYNSL